MVIIDTLVILKHTSASGPKADGAQGPKSEAAEEEMAELDEPVQQRGRQQNSQQRASDLAFLDLQQGGFNMLQREPGALRRSVNTCLCRMESRVYPLLVSTEVNLRRVADSAECCAPPFGNTEHPSVSLFKAALFICPREDGGEGITLIFGCDCNLFFVTY